MDTRRYIARETLVSVLINGALSAGFTWLVFHARESIAPFGAAGYALDFGPQTFIVALMSVAPPSLITRARLKAGRLTSGGSSATMRPLWLRAMLAAVLMLIVVGAAAIVVSTILPTVSLGALIAIKAAYGATIAALVTPWAVRQALQEPMKASAASVST